MVLEKFNDCIFSGLYLTRYDIGNWSIENDKTWKTMQNNSWCCCRCDVLIVWKTWYTIDALYMIQTIIAYQHLAPTIPLLRHAAFCNHKDNRSMFLNMIKGTENHNSFIENSCYFHFYCAYLHLLFFVLLPVHLKINFVSLYLVNKQKLWINLFHTQKWDSPYANDLFVQLR